MLTITRKLEFDAGHRIPDHKSQCRNLHGHRYTLEITLTGQVISVEGNSDNGMIMDFSDIKALAKEHLVDVWDHAFLVYEKDHAVRDFLATLPDHKTVVIDRIPTVENLAQIAFDILKAAYKDRFGTGLHLHKLVLHNAELLGRDHRCLRCPGRLATLRPGCRPRRPSRRRWQRRLLRRRMRPLRRRSRRPLPIRPRRTRRRSCAPRWNRRSTRGTWAKCRSARSSSRMA